MANTIHTPAADITLDYRPNKIRTAVLKSGAVQAMLLAKAQGIAARANGMHGAKGYGAKIKVGQTRARAIVYTGNKHTMRSNIKYNTLQKALGGGK